MVGRRLCRKQSRVLWFCSIILPFCVAQILSSQPGPDPTMIIKTKGRRAAMEFNGYFARNPHGRTGFLPYQSPFILKLIPLGHNADTTSALKKSILLLCTKPQILCRGKHFSQNMCIIALVCTMGARQGGTERATHTYSLCQWDCLQLISAPIKALALLSCTRGPSAEELQVQEYGAETLHLPHSKSCCNLKRNTVLACSCWRNLAWRLHQKLALEVQKIPMYFAGTVSF